MHPSIHLFCLVAAATLAIPAFAIRMPVSADSHVRTSLPLINFGALPQLQLTPGEAEAMVRFDLSALAGVPEAQMQRATLILYVSRVVTPGRIVVGAAETSWQESAVNYGSRPNLLAGSSIVPLSGADLTQANTFVSVDVTAIVRSWTAGRAPNHGFVMQPGTASAFLDSKENSATSQPAALEVQLAGPAGPPGPQGLQGVQGPQGPVGPQGVPGVVSLAGLSCPSGQFVTGFTAAGQLICGGAAPPPPTCSAQGLSTTMTSISDGAFIPAQFWPGGTVVLGSGTCTVTVRRPSNFIDVVGSLGDAWSVQSFTGFRSCTLTSVQTPVCNSPLAIGTVTANRPSCSSALGNTPSTATASVTCVP